MKKILIVLMLLFVPSIGLAARTPIAQLTGSTTNKYADRSAVNTQLANAELNFVELYSGAAASFPTCTIDEDVVAWDITTSAWVCLTLPSITFPDNNGLTVVDGAVTVNSPVIVAGTVELNTTTVASSGAIPSGDSKLLVTHATATDALTTDSCSWEFIGDPVAKTGFVPSANGMLAVWCYVDANGYVQVRTINNTAASITLNTAGNGATVKWMVRR